MKKITILILSVITLILTLMFAEVFSIYHLGSIPTLLTSLYLLSFFLLFEYIAISIAYIIEKIIKNERISIKKYLALILMFIALLLVLLFLIVIDIDYLNWYSYSTPFYQNVIVRGIEFLLPTTVLITISILLLKTESTPAKKAK